MHVLTNKCSAIPVVTCLYWCYCNSHLICVSPSRIFPVINILTHWGRVTHICVVKLTIIGSDNGLSPGRRQAIIWTNAVILLIGPLGTNFSEILIEIRTFSFKKMRLKVSSAKWRPFCLGLNVLIQLYWWEAEVIWQSTWSRPVSKLTRTNFYLAIIK